MSIIEFAHDQYRIVDARDTKGDWAPLHFVREVFDFATSEEMPMVAVDLIETQREQHRRRFVGNPDDTDLTREEFLHQLGIDVDSTRNPESGQSIMDVTDAQREYYGDPEDEAYRAFHFNLKQYDDEVHANFVQTSTIVGDNVRREHLKHQHLEEKIAGMTASASGRCSSAPSTSAKVEGHSTASSHHFDEPDMVLTRDYLTQSTAPPLVEARGPGMSYKQKLIQQHTRAGGAHLFLN